MNYLIVGASSGIGLELAKILVANNHHVFSASRHAPPNLAVSHFSFDAQKPDLSFVANLPNEIHGFVYAPGTINLKPFHRISPEDFQNDFQINVLGGVAVLQAILPHLKRANGASTLFFSTVAVQTGMGFHSSVATSKGAIEGLTRSLAAEFAPHKIRVNAIAPSLTDTPLANFLLSTPEKQEASNKRHPLGRYGSAQEVAEAASFLLSEKASWITGQIFAVDGGVGSLK